MPTLIEYLRNKKISRGSGSFWILRDPRTIRNYRIGGTRIRFSTLALHNVVSVRIIQGKQNKRYNNEAGKNSIVIRQCFQYGIG